MLKVACAALEIEQYGALVKLKVLDKLQSSGGFDSGCRLALLLTVRLPPGSGVAFPVWLISLWFPSFLRRPLQRPEVCAAAGEVSRWTPIARRLFRSPESRQSFILCVFLSRSRHLKWGPSLLFFHSLELLAGASTWLMLVVTNSMRGGCKRFVAIKSKSFDLTIVGIAEDVLKISENGRGRRTSVLSPENVALWAGKFLQLSVINKGKRTFVIFPNERSWAKIFDALTEIVNLTFSSTSGALRRPPHQVTMAHGVAPPRPPLPPPPPPGCCTKYGFISEPKCFLRSVPHIAATTLTRNVNEATEELSLSRHMQVDRGKQRVITELGMRASRSVSVQATSDTFVPLTRDAVVSHQVHRGSLVFLFWTFILYQIP
ncbi:LOW QUALITY PROTEIN: hypothetical protein Cgig2_008998 [Carnegiea gigantea]|uniref:Uncharacterized protein n=1 Tax=Carnegiea gigantea TaxID=171969 RepID=A0A9Q1GK60_9CARY|nr:LOW QUALITY PROTEIN: hypothetical protein Cgig2_008998 [Carnegiea gigantea]